MYTLKNLKTNIIGTGSNQGGSIPYQQMEIKNNDFTVVNQPKANITVNKPFDHHVSK